MHNICTFAGCGYGTDAFKEQWARDLTSGRKLANFAHKDMVMIAIPADAPGISFGPLYDTPSNDFLPMSEMYLENVVVSEDNTILPIGQGFEGSLMAIDIARVSIASGCCGLMQAALDTAFSYFKNRKMFGGKNLDLEGI